MKGLQIINLLLITYIHCRDFFFTLDQKITTSTFQCLKQKNVTHIGLRYIYDDQGVDPDTAQDFINALNAGLTVDAIFVAYREVPIQTQISYMRKNFQANFVNKFLMLPLGRWDNYSSEQNCLFFTEYVAGMRAAGLRAGIWTDDEFWNTVLDPKNICTSISNFMALWWEPTGEQDDGQPSFNSYKQIGGWKEPYMKEYSRASACGINFGVSYYK